MQISQWKKNFDKAKILKIKIVFKKNISENINTKNFENKISRFLRVEYVVLFTSRITSILVSLLSLNLKKKMR